MNSIKNSNLTLYISLFWVVFWLFNGIDKFAYHTDIGFMTWYGKDRDWQFLTYLTNMQLPTIWVKFILYFSGAWEILLASIFGLSLWKSLVNKDQTSGIYAIALKLALLTFIGFCGFDIVAGDRAELLEHSTYVGIVGISHLILLVESSIQAAQK